MNNRNRRALALSIPLALIAALAVVQSTRGIYYSKWVQDIFIPFEGVNHIQNGSLPSRDFVSPIGALYYFVHYLPTLFAPLSARTIIYANLLVGLLVAIVVGIFGAKRVPLAVAAATSFYAGVVAISPRQIGESPLFISYNASYNRFGWAFICAFVFITALPAWDRRRATDAWDGVAAGSLLAALFFTKVTYFAAGMGLVVAAVLTTRRQAPWFFLACVAAAVVVVLAAVQSTTGLLGHYFADMRAVASVPSSNRMSHAFKLLYFSSYGGLVVILLSLVRAGDVTRFRAWLAPILFALATVLAGVAIGAQNHPELENPLLPIVAIVAWFGTSPARRLELGADIRSDAPPSPIWRWLGRGVDPVGRLGIGLLLLIPLSQDIASSLATAVAPVAQGREVAWLAGTPLQDLRLARRDAKASTEPAAAPTNDVEYAIILSDGVELLRRHLKGRTDAVVLSLTWSNPFPTLLNLPPVAYELAWWDKDRSFTAATLPEAGRLMAKLDYVLIPARYYNYDTTLAMLAAYEGHLARAFHPVERTANWTLLARRDCLARDLC